MPPSSRIVLLDAARGFTILWVAALHFYFDTRGVPDRSVVSAGAAWAAAAEGHYLDAAIVVVRSIAGLPGFRLDLLLFITGLVLMLGRRQSTRTFYRRRASAILPTYWAGSLAVFAALAALAALRAAARGSGFEVELHHGTLLAQTPYRFEWLDLVRSGTVVGRMQDVRAMQSVAPSLWYIVLVLQFLAIFPLMRWAYERAGPVWFLAGCTLVTCAGRALVFAYDPLPSFDANATVICFVPFRLISPALGMVAARSLPVAPLFTRRQIRRLLPAAFVLLVESTWLGIGMNDPGTLAGVLGPLPPLALAVPAVAVFCAAAVEMDAARSLLLWAGRHSLSLLVMQDVMRLVVGTLVSLGVALDRWTFVAMAPYLLVTVALGWAWGQLGIRDWGSPGSVQVPVVTSE